MAGGVIEVRSTERLGVLERLWLPGLLRAGWIATRRLCRSLPEDEGPGSGLHRRAPHERPAYVRGMPVLITDEGIPRCVGCELCAEICPTQCIRLRVSPGPPQGEGPGASESEPSGATLTPLEVFEIDMARCLCCGLCEEACPAFALAMSPLVEIAAPDRAGLVFDLDALSVPAPVLGKRGQPGPDLGPGDNP
ncbi:MAG: 4Fe-4S dicluster domain-containing protein [Myxococcota bacterium]|nr:4Fe-4S dicluster domain-containing protein [Myxococcota bacterium]